MFTLKRYPKGYIERIKYEFAQEGVLAYLIEDMSQLETQSFLSYLKKDKHKVCLNENCFDIKKNIIIIEYMYDDELPIVTINKELFTNTLKKLINLPGNSEITFQTTIKGNEITECEVTQT